MDAGSLLPNRRVVVVFLIQVVGYAALLNAVPHSQPTALAATLGVLPSIVLVALAVPALPAFVLTVVVGAVLAAIGLPPESLPALALARGDALFFVSAYVLGVAAAHANRRTEALVG